MFRFLRVSALAASLVAGASLPAFAQAGADFSGVWQPRYHEDQPDRIPGPELTDYTGLPLNDSARQYANSWDPSRLTLPEEQCRVHVSPPSMNVAVLSVQHSKMFGHFASWQTVCRFNPLIRSSTAF